MASQFAEGFQNLMMAQMDPMNGVMRSFASGTVAQQQLQLKEQKLELMRNIRNELKQAIDEQAPKSVVAIYEKMLADMAAS